MAIPGDQDPGGETASMTPLSEVLHGVGSWPAWLKAGKGSTPDLAGSAGSVGTVWPKGHPTAPLLSALTGLCLSAIPLLAEQGYSFRDNQIVSETREHWEAWDVNAGISWITPEGSVSPRFLRKRVNVAPEAPRYEVKVKGGVSAGSNEHLAHHLIDGDPGTYWEPDLDRPPEDWWVQLRLGRLVVVEKIVLRFVEEEAGEPFLQFDVLGWRFPPPWGSVKYTLLGTDVARFWSLYKTDRPNRTRRVFEVQPQATTSPSGEFLGEPLDVLHILVTDSAADRMREVAPDTWEALPPDSRGAVKYYRKGGVRQTLTTRESYESLPPERQGRIRYYQRERPRLAEVEVWTWGDNLNYDRGRQGGKTQLWINSQLNPRGKESGGKIYSLANLVTDANYTTGPTFWSKGKTYFLEDLGTQFWVERVQYLTQEAYVTGLDVSDGTLAPDGSVEWTELVEGKPYRPAGQDALQQVSVFHIEPTRVRHLRSRVRSHAGALLEVMIYGEGYVAEVALTSEAIEMRRHQSFVSIEWETDTPVGTWVEIATRTGDRLREQLTYYDSDGLVVTADRYNRRLPRPKQGEIVSRMVPDSDWSPWTRPYLESGEEVRSPLRKYLQIRARVMADTVSKYGPPASLHAIRVNLTDLYAEELIGEVWPRFVERIGEPEERSFLIRPRFTRSDQGFDRFRITATAPTTMELVEVRSGTLEDFAKEETERWLPEDLEITSSGADTLLFRLPSPVRQGVELVEVRLRPTIYGHSAAFEAGVKATGAVGTWQKVEIGNAAAHAPSESNVVVALGDNAALTALRVEPSVVTPNGDGINDAAVFRFSVNRLHSETEIQLSIYDLGGRLVYRRGAERADPRGRYALEWRGEGMKGGLIPPGTYLARVGLPAYSERAQQTSLTRILRVAY